MGSFKKKLGSSVKKSIGGAKRIVKNTAMTAKKAVKGSQQAVLKTGKIALKVAGNTIKGVTGVNIFAGTEFSANQGQQKVVDTSYKAYILSLFGVSNVKYVGVPDEVGKFDKSLIPKLL